MGTIGFAINVVSTLFLFGDLMTEHTLQRVLSVATYVGAATALVALAMRGLRVGSAVDALAGLWAQHETWKLGMAAGLLLAAALILVTMAFAGCLKNYRHAGRIGLVLYCISAAMLVVTALVAHGSPPPAYAASIDWPQLHPTLAIHQTYATASLWGLFGLVYLPLYAGRFVADSLARLVTWKTVVRAVNVVLVVVGWILQIVPYN